MKVVKIIPIIILFIFLLMILFFLSRINLPSNNDLNELLGNPPIEKKIIDKTVLVEEKEKMKLNPNYTLLKNLLSNNFNISSEEIYEKETLEEIGIKNSNLITLKLLLKEEFDIQSKDEELKNLKTVKDILIYIDDKRKYNH